MNSDEEKLAIMVSYVKGASIISRCQELGGGGMLL